MTGSEEGASAGEWQDQTRALAGPLGSVHVGERQAVCTRTAGGRFGQGAVASIWEKDRGLGLRGVAGMRKEMVSWVISGVGGEDLRA